MTTILVRPLATRYSPCDKCGVRAIYRAVNEKVDIALDFCGHHAAANESGLKEAGFVLHAIQ